MAGLSELHDEGALSGMLINMRDRRPDVSSNCAGNYERVVMFPAAEGANNPAFFRSLGKRCAHFGLHGNQRLTSEGGPKESMQAANFSIVTNWAGLAQFIAPAGSSVLCHCPASNFVLELAGFDMAVIFAADDKGTIGVMTNHTAGARGQELGELI